MSRKNAPSAAFTIVEIMVVVIIIGLLVTLMVPKFFGKIGKAKQTVAQQKLKYLEGAIDMFYYQYGRFPRNLDELVNRPSDIDQEKWTPPSIKGKDLRDPWDGDFVYMHPGAHGRYDLYSLGADGQEGGQGENADIENWEL